MGHLTVNQPTNGIFVFKPGCYYVGNIKDLTASGEGKYQNKENGYAYEGLWSKNLQHGNGKEFYQNNNETFEGEFMYGSKFGLGKYTFSNGRIY
jgi:radial spoke head protein 1